MNALEPLESLGAVKDLSTRWNRLSCPEWSRMCERVRAAGVAQRG